ncbi:MAG: PD-(D/E)XK nuclease family protein [Lachnospiraceae bacterium]|nr:PD-(D/E)XK nuclease family protein [Lachnospiraceae bacterium]
MALQLYLGGSGSGKSYKLYKHIINESLKHPELTYLFLVPEQYNLSTQLKLISMHPNKGMLNIDVLSFTRLAHRVFEEVGYKNIKGSVIDDIGKNLILRYMAGKNRDKLTALSDVYSKLGYISEVKSVISEFMQYGIGDKELTELIDKSRDREILKSKLTDIQLLYREFLKYINEKYITTEEILQKVSDAVPGSLKLKKSVIVLDGYTGFTPVQAKLLAVLLQNTVDVYMTLLFDVNYGQNTSLNEQDLFYLSRKTLSMLERVCREKEIKKKPDEVILEEVPARFAYDINGKPIKEKDKRRDLIHLERNMFRAGEKAFEEEARSIHIFTGSTPEDEAVETAVRIEKLIREEGYHYKDIAVVTGDPDTYINVCKRAFSRYGIPFFADRTEPVLLNPMIELIRSLFDIIIEDYSYEAVFRYLRTGMTDYSRKTIDELENYVLRYGIKGRKKWKESFVLKPRYMEVSRLEELNGLRSDLSDKFELLYRDIQEGNPLAEENNISQNSKYDVRVISAALYKYLSRDRIYEKMLKLSEQFKETEDTVRAKEYEKLYEEICLLLDKMVSFLPDEEVTIKEYSELLDAGFAEIRTGVIPGTDDYVQIGDITRSRLRDIKALFFVGVNDGIIPSNLNSGGIISDMERDFLTEENEGEDKKIELAPTARMQAYTQRLYLYMLVTKPSEELYISYSGLSQDGKSINPSYFVKMIRRMFPKLKPEIVKDDILNRIYNMNTAYVKISAEMQDAVNRYDENQLREYFSLFKVFLKEEKYRNGLKKIMDAAFEKGDFSKKDEISKAVAAALYGTELTCSITRLENYAKCAYAHFLKYGLGIKERELFSFEASDMGSVFHDVLQMYAVILKDRGVSWLNIDPEDRNKVIDDAIERCIARDNYGAVYGTFRTKHTITRIRRIMLRTVDTLTLQLKKGRFEPYSFEFDFSSGNDYNSLNLKLDGEGKLRLIGRIDRMDICKDNEKVYVKIIDYKSGNKNFDLAAIYLGLDLQLVVYMNAACEYFGKISNERNKPEVIPAGMFYYHIDDPVIDCSSEDISGPFLSEAEDVFHKEIEKKIAAELRMSGLTNSDNEIYRLIDEEFSGASEVIPVGIKKNGELTGTSKVAGTEDFKIISEYVNKKISQMGSEILDGNIKAEAHKESPKKNSPCLYCEYSGICGYKGEGIVSDAGRELFEGDDPEDGENTRSLNEYILDMMRKAVEE